MKADVAFAEDAVLLHAKAAVLMDGDTGRVLYGKNETEILPMASTTKIMTLILALEYGNPEDLVTVSSYAAKMPDVKLGMRTGEQYRLLDLLYSMMLESHNDSACAVAEHIGGSVESFAKMMNRKAEELGLISTYFITPNGLDAEDAHGVHSTSARDLAKLMRYCVFISEKKDAFRKICQTRQYSFSNQEKTRSFALYNKNALLDQMEGVIAGKTGFTGDAGYCYVCAYTDNERTLCIALLGCGWPPSRNYKWSDVRYLLALGSKYKKTHLLSDKISFYIPINNDNESFCRLDVPSYDISILTGENDDISYDIIIPESLDKMPDIDFIYGYISIYINNEFVLSISLDNLADNY